jgi:hypothetical protein
MTFLTDDDRHSLFVALEHADTVKAMIEDAMMTVTKNTVADWDLTNALSNLTVVRASIARILMDDVRRRDTELK